MEKKITFEVCCASLDGALNAQMGGADRIELNCATDLGGLTPSLGLLTECKAALKIPVLAMVRPRGGGFCYTDNEAKTMYRDAETLLRHGADGIVFGFLKADGTVDSARCKEMLDIIDGSTSVFNRAIDTVPGIFDALDALIESRVKRVLTSGGRQTALEGAQAINAMMKRAAGRLEILAGGGVRTYNIGEVLKLTGCNQIHFSCRKRIADNSTAANPFVRFNASALSENSFYVTDGEGVAEIIKAAKG
ncbi:MAG: copper homeostasis protein CutC [Firmicutes bacterium]|nr:copper homeostasis protein CutC [Bacillota bacterium]